MSAHNTGVGGPPQRGLRTDDRADSQGEETQLERRLIAQSETIKRLDNRITFLTEKVIPRRERKIQTLQQRVELLQDRLARKHESVVAARKTSDRVRDNNKELLGQSAYYRALADQLKRRLNTVETNLEQLAQRIASLKNSSPPDTLITRARDEATPPIAMIVSGGSNGSHLLARMIAEYRPFFIGQESTLASLPGLFDPSSFRKVLMRGLLRRGVDPIVPSILLSNGERFLPVSTVFFTHRGEYHCDDEEGLIYLLESADWGDMIARLRDRLAAYGVAPDDGVLIEHTPATSLSARAMLDAYPEAKVIHLVRDPRDAISSMIQRRKRLPNFAGLSDSEIMEITAIQWHIYTTCALKAEGHPGYLRVSYEGLVNEPQAVIRRVLAHLDTPEAKRWPNGPWMLSPLRKQTGWRHGPADKVSNNSVGRYKEALSSDLLEKLVNMSIAEPAVGVDGTMAEMIERFSAPE